MKMKKIIACLLIIIGLANFTLTREIIKNWNRKAKIVDQMYASPSGIKAIVSRLELKIFGNELITFSAVLFLLLLGAGIIILFSERIGLTEVRLKKLEEWQKQK